MVNLLTFCFLIFVYSISHLFNLFSYLAPTNPLSTQTSDSTYSPSFGSLNFLVFITTGMNRLVQNLILCFLYLTLIV